MRLVSLDVIVVASTLTRDRQQRANGFTDLRANPAVSLSTKAQYGLATSIWLNGLRNLCLMLTFARDGRAEHRMRTMQPFYAQKGGA
jgi:hypothetical protein